MPAISQKHDSSHSNESSILSNTHSIQPVQPDVSSNMITNHSFGIRKRVNFKLNNAQDDIVEELEENKQVVMRKVYRRKNKKKRCGTENSVRKYNALDYKLNLKNIVFNGTFPIDYPLKSRFEVLGSSSSSGLDYSDEYEDREQICEHEFIDTNEQNYEDEEATECTALHSMSIQELVEDKKFNITKMKKEIQVSLAEFEKFLAKGGPNHNRNVRTYSIDEPL